MKSGALVLAGALVCGLTGGPPAAAGQGAATATGQTASGRGPAVVLNEDCYWRYFFACRPARVSPDRLRSEGLACLGEQLTEQVRQATLRRLKREGRTPDDWTEEVTLIGDSGGWSFQEVSIAIAERLRTDGPPEGWIRGDFDDSDWPRQKVPYLVGRFYRSGNMQVRQACLRTRFVVPDPARAEGLVLRAGYRGGVRVFLNGTEIARGHVPPGPLADDAPAEAYPADAYVLRDGEYLQSDYEQTGYYAQYWQKVNGRVIVPELPERFDDLAERKDSKDFRNQGNCALNRAGYDRVTALRDRAIQVPVDRRLLVRGENLLAIELRASDLHPWATQWFKAYVRSHQWYHAALWKVRLEDPGGTIPSAMARPEGVQVWSEDIHRRLYAPDFHEPGNLPNPARMVAARNGTFAAQVAVGTTRDLTGLTAAVESLRHAHGRTQLPATAARVLYGLGHTNSELKSGDPGRRVGNSPDFDIWQVTATRYGSKDAPFFDHLTADGPVDVPAGTARAIWVSVTVPADAAPGTYRGAVNVRAEGLPPVRVPLEVEVMDWRIPDPADFQTVMALEQCPYASAEHYKVPPWSEAHWELLDRTFAYLGEVDNDWLNVPVLSYTEFGNRQDSPVCLIRKADGGLAADYAVLDRYLDLAMKHCGRPMVVNFVVMHNGHPGDSRFKSPPMEVGVRDEKTGRTEPLAIDQLDPEGRRQFWKFLSTSIYGHMKARGLQNAVYWGYTWDGQGCDPNLPPLLAEYVPGVYWTKGSHQQGPSQYVRAVATAYSPHVAIGFRSRQGWKRPDLWLTYVRYWGTIIDASDYSTPFSYRMMMDRAVTAGSRGIGRVGADYWGSIYLSGLKGQTYPVGVPIQFLLWPGRHGPEPSVRFEVLREGLQEAETRIFLEQVLDKRTGAEWAELKDRAAAVLDRHNVATLLDPPAASRYQLAEACATGWQRRSRDLYAVAAEVSERVGLDLSAADLSITVAPGGTAEAKVKVRNWSRQQRQWRLTNHQDWLVLPRPAGRLEPGRQEELALTVDAARLPPEPGPARPSGPSNKPPPPRKVQGLLTFTDLHSGRMEFVEITVLVPPAG